jgi:glutamate-1-semialdehyde 2,1-aminomutase
MNEIYLSYGILVIAIWSVLNKVSIRLQLSRAKHPSLLGHSKWSRRIAALIKSFSYNEQVFYQTDGAPDDVAVKRKKALQDLGVTIQKQSPRTFEHALSLEQNISDVQFVSHYRVPFPFSLYLPKVFKLGSIIDESKGTKVKDIDGNWRYDLSGSYGVNVFGYDFYKSCLAKGSAKVADLGPALGSYHPLIGENVNAIKDISGLDEVSFHMSGTEAVMQAVRLARYHTKKTHLVRLCGAYHGWWDGVQPGVGNRRKTNDVYTLADLSENLIAKKWLRKLSLYLMV